MTYSTGCCRRTGESEATDMQASRLLTERAELAVPRRSAPRMGSRYDADAFGRMSEAIARFLGTGRFLAGQTILVVGWIVLNSIAPLNLLAQNRQDDRDRASVERDREVATRTQSDTEFLARELAAVRLALADVVTTS